MNREFVLDLIRRSRLIAILRGDMHGRELEILAVLKDAGICAVEMSIVSPGFDVALARMAATYGATMAIGAGTILTPDNLARAVTAGASFIVSPDGNREVIESTLREGLVSLPGAFTATEIVQVMRWGADAVKLFPAGSVGPDYVRTVRAPLPGLRMVPTGGVRLSDLPAYWRAGAWAAGVGSELVNAERLQDSNLVELQQVARAFAVAARKEEHAAA